MSSHEAEYGHPETKLDPYYAYVRERNLNNQLRGENEKLEAALVEILKYTGTGRFIPAEALASIALLAREALK